MNRLIAAFEEFLTDATLSGGSLARTAQFALDHVNWNDPPIKHDPSDNHVVKSQLEAACNQSGPQGSITNKVAQTLLSATSQIRWITSSEASDDGPDVELFLRKFAYTNVIGDGGFLPSAEVNAGFSLQAADTYYPPHAHTAEESCWIVGGDADWKVNTKPWFAVAAGDSIYHQSGARHAMQTNEKPLLAIWLWTSHLDSEVIIVRS